MKASSTLSILIAIGLLAPALLTAQQWTDNLPQKSEPYTFYEYQQAFNDFWEPYNVSNGYYIDENGERQKAAGWKLFKRWEWYWESRIDPRNGEFPQANRIEAYQQEMLRYPSPMGTRDGDGNTVDVSPIYDLDAGLESGEDNYVLLDYWLNHGSGPGDMFADIPDSVFGDHTCVYLYSKFGVNEGAHAGFEEWAVLGI